MSSTLRERFNPALPLRLGLGAMLIYSGLSLIRDPDEWRGFLPEWFVGTIGRFWSADTFLAVQGAGELLLALVFLAWFLPTNVVRLAALLLAAHLSLILFVAGIDLITFRDVGLIGAALALALMRGDVTARPT